MLKLLLLFAFRPFLRLSFSRLCCDHRWRTRHDCAATLGGTPCASFQCFSNKSLSQFKPGLPSQALGLRVCSALVLSVQVLLCLTRFLKGGKTRRPMLHCDTSLRSIPSVAPSVPKETSLASCMRICRQLCMIDPVSVLAESPQLKRTPTSTSLGVLRS